jgi:hypothetical protein
MSTRRPTIASILDPYPSAELTLTPTPIHRMDRLSTDLSGDLWVMREDLTGFALGGNKVRSWTTSSAMHSPRMPTHS